MDVKGTSGEKMMTDSWGLQCPAVGRAVYMMTDGDVVTLARTSKEMNRFIDWAELVTRGASQCFPRRDRPLIPVRPVKMPPGAVAALIRCSGLSTGSDCRKFLEELSMRGSLTGRVVQWGLTDENQRLDKPTDGNFVAIAAGSYHSVALRDDGRVVTWGSPDSGERHGAPTGDGFVAIAAGDCHSVALDKEGRIVAWGCDWHSQCRTAPTGTGFIDIACGPFHSAGLHETGRVVIWGCHQDSHPGTHPTGDGYVAIACGSRHTVTLHEDGRVDTWGETDRDFVRSHSRSYAFMDEKDLWESCYMESQLYDAPTDKGYVRIACYGKESVALRSDGRIVTWGGYKSMDIDVDMPTDAGYVALAAGEAHCLALHETGRVVIWGDYSEDQRVGAPTDDGYVAIACGEFHSVALHEDGHIVTWGSHTY